MRFRSVSFHLITQQFCRSHQITRIRQKGLVEINFKEIKNTTNNQNFLMDDTYKGEAVTPGIHVYKEKFQSGGSL